MTYDIDENEFIDSGPNATADTSSWTNVTEYGTGVYYSQLNDKLYTIEKTGYYIHVYDLGSSSVRVLTEQIPNYVNHSACMASASTPSPRLYVTGGESYRDEYMKNLQIFDVDTAEWTAGPDMNYTRGWHGCIVVNDWLWVMGHWAQIEAIDIVDTDSDSMSLCGKQRDLYRLHIFIHLVSLL